MDLENDRNVINNNVTSLDKKCSETTKEYLDSNNRTTSESKKEDTTVNNEIIPALNMEVVNDDENVGNSVENTIEDCSILPNIPENTPTNDLDSPALNEEGKFNERLILLQGSDSITDRVEGENHSAPNRIDSDSEVVNDDENVGNSVENTIEDNSVLPNIPENTPMNDSDSPALNEERKSNKRRILLQDSDSEDESITAITDHVEGDNDDTHFAPNRIDSDSEDENLTNNDTTSARKASRLIDSDSEESETPQVSNTDSKQLPENNIERWRLLCDPESSDEEYKNDTEFKSDNEEGVTKPIVYKRKKSKHNKEEPAAAAKITPKEASKVRQEIKRESQRMVRESNVSLPYHKPKPFTIKDFLSRRSQMASAVLPVINTKTPPPVAIKMSMDQLEAVTKKLKKREKEIKEFYKSESEDDEGEESNDQNKKAEGGVEPCMTGTEEVINSNDEGQVVQNQQETVALDNTDETAHSNHSSENELCVQNTTEVEPEVVSNEENCTNEETTLVENCQESMGHKLSTGDSEDQSDSLQQPLQCVELHKEIEVEPNNEAVSNEETCTSEEPARLVEKYQESMDYEFSISDPEDRSESLQQPFQYGELDREIERFQTAEEKRSKIELIKLKFGNSAPRLSGNPNELINLETGASRPSELTEFVERFMKHSEKKQIHKDKVKLNIISVESGEIQEETIAMDVEEDNLTIEEKPGMRLKKLRDELESQMAQMKSEFWQKKSLVKEETEKTKEGYEEGEDDDVLDDEEEEELSEEDEEEDDDEIYEEKERKKSEFVDDEAEDECEEMTNDEEQNEACEDDASEDEAVNDKDNCNIDEKAPKKLKRILQGFVDDSDEEDNADVSFEDSKLDSTEANSRDGDMRISITEDSTQDDEGIPLNQQTGQTVKTPLKTSNKSFSEFLTPISYITGLQNLNKSASKNLKDSPVSPFRIPNVPSPLRDSNWQSSLQKRLFNDGEITNSQIDDMAEMCSENFTESQAVEEQQSSQITCTQDLLNVCSGNFCSSESAELITQDLNSNSTRDSPSDSTQDSLSNSTQTVVERNERKELKGLDFEENNLISQLLDEEEMKNFKKKIESPLKAAEESDGNRGGVIDSDDDGDGEKLEVRTRKMKTKLQFSDEESSDDEKEYPGNDEKIDLYDEDDENEEITDLSPENVDYDSEENEVLLDSNLAAKPKLKASDFFEDEAELSESDWDSADEDEKGLDAMEEEQGDAEKYDEDEVRQDLEKIHMRRLLDDDTKEVKLLQELYLEDGEFHGTGRERKFRWRNIDSFNDEEGQEKKNEDETYLDDEEESEEQWRKKRHEREMFLMEEKKKRQEVDAGSGSDEDELLSDSQLLKLGRKVIKKSLNGSSAEKVNKNVEEKLDYKSVFTIVNRRGSFLSRGEQVLQRVATYNKESTSSVSVTKTSKNFLFQTISSKETTITTWDRKRPAADGTPKKIKKLRLSENLSPANRKPGGNGSAKGKSLSGNVD